MFESALLLVREPMLVSKKSGILDRKFVTTILSECVHRTPDQHLQYRDRLGCFLSAGIGTRTGRSFSCFPGIPSPNTAQKPGEKLIDCQFVWKSVFITKC